MPQFLVLGGRLNPVRGWRFASSVRKLTLELDATIAIGGATTFSLAQAQREARCEATDG